MPSRSYLILRITACLSVTCLATACGSSDSRAARLLQDYQTAAATNDVAGARQALLKLVSVKEDVPDYWVELGRLEQATGSYGEAYYAFTRAYELNRGDPNVLQAVTELALRTGDLDRAERHAHELEIVSPGNPWIKLTEGWAAVKEGRYDDALRSSDQMLENSPNDPSAIGLKARSLISLHRDAEAEALLTKEVQNQPSDIGSALMLASFYVRAEQWARAAVIARTV